MCEVTLVSPANSESRVRGLSNLALYWLLSLPRVRRDEGLGLKAFLPASSWKQKRLLSTKNCIEKSG